MANGTIAFDTLSTSGQISGTAKSVDADYVVSGSAKYYNRLILMAMLKQIILINLILLI